MMICASRSVWKISPSSSSSRSRALKLSTLPFSHGGNSPRPRQRGSGADGCENGAEDSGPGRRARGVDHGAHGGFALSRPHGPVAVGHLALNDGWSQGPLTGIVRDLDPTGMIQEGQELIAGPADLGLEGPGQVAGTRGGEDAGQVPVERPTPGRQR